MISHDAIDRRTLHRQIMAGILTLAGNRKLKIYGSLTCASGKRMNRLNRVFFKTENEALALGFRKCKRCMQG
jgi:methylphosphotriester-DNA--protein-cysteine methyltransferase